MKRKCRGTHIGVFGHWVELEKERALNNLTHLAEKREITVRNVPYTI